MLYGVFDSIGVIQGIGIHGRRNILKRSTPVIMPLEHESL